MTENVATSAVRGSRSRAGEGRLALRTPEAAAALGVSRDHFDRHVAPELRCIYSGRVRLYAVAELERWLERSAGPAPVSQTGGGSLARMDRGAA